MLDASLLSDVTGTTYRLRISVSDGEFTKEAGVGFIVRTSNDVPTAPDALFELTEIPSIQTGEPVTSVALGQITGTDPDGDSVRYSVGGNFVSTATIDASGNITITDVSILDYEKHAAFTIPIVVSDGRAASVTNVRIVLTNVDDNRPPTVTSANFVIAENTPIGTLVGTVSGTDPDLPP